MIVVENNILYIGLNGFAGSGKDTVAKMIRHILEKHWNSDFNTAWEEYRQTYTNPAMPATFSKVSVTDMTDFKSVASTGFETVFCIAFADQLKFICSSIFGIPVERFYQNKSTAWICINKKFQYTEIKPNDSSIITAEDYYNNISSYAQDSESYWMSLREILVYVGTYVLQQDINKNIFVNIVNNTIKERLHRNPSLKYAIVTDIRFSHEIEYIREKNGITINIYRDGIEQLDNVAEHDLDDETNWDYVIENNGTYEELFRKVWDMLHDNVIFSNDTISLMTRDNINNFLRKVDENKYMLCSEFGTVRISKEEGNIVMVDPVGGPAIFIGNKIEGTELIPQIIKFDEKNSGFCIYC